MTSGIFIGLIGIPLAIIALALILYVLQAGQDENKDKQGTHDEDISEGGMS
ncbi:hypothetical protein [Caldalkalibacillus salinus]|uniref:hypothetical protein n=1 Tax=Caldalkalibacillus salinus TaxID=2803787 RepID=UPI001923CBEF|nr:hypothetical protein [Caldalkalibacillus salinus]